MLLWFWPQFTQRMEICSTFWCFSICWAFLHAVGELGLQLLSCLSSFLYNSLHSPFLFMFFMWNLSWSVLACFIADIFTFSTCFSCLLLLDFCYNLALMNSPQLNSLLALKQSCAYLFGIFSYLQFCKLSYHYIYVQIKLKYIRHASIYLIFFPIEFQIPYPSSCFHTF